MKFNYIFFFNGTILFDKAVDKWNNDIKKKLIQNYGLFFSLIASINNDHEF